MIFNSVEYLIFLPTVFMVYWFLLSNKTPLQNLILLFSSYLFYGWWDYRFLILILVSSLIDFVFGRLIFDTSNLRKKKSYLTISIAINLGFLFVFKYYNFFIENLFLGLQDLGFEQRSFQTLNLILPVGISFYTFQSMSYSIDCYRKKISPTDDLISFLTYVAFFPQLVAGPIESAKKLLPQIQKTRLFDYKEAIIGCRLILWGLFKKVVIADTVALSVNEIFGNPMQFNGGVLFLGVVYFSIQIYCDFSGYSDIAIGSARLFGIKLSTNFNYPYFSKSIAEFWRRWHISLTTWFNEYLFYPISISLVRTIGKYGNLVAFFIYFFLIGFWHGPKSSYISFAIFHWVLFIPSILNIHLPRSLANKIPSILKMGFTYFLVLISLVLFRSNTWIDGVYYIKQMILGLALPNSHRFMLLYVMFLFFFDYRFRKNPTVLFRFKSKFIRYVTYLLIALLILFYFGYNRTEFIYFQF